MNDFIKILLVCLVFSIPFWAFYFFINSLNKRSRLIVTNFLTPSSIYIKDVKVLFKNFNLFERKNKFQLDLYDTLYDYHLCDLVLNDNQLMVIGKMVKFEKTIYLTPTVVISKTKASHEKENSRTVICKDIRDSNATFDIEFVDQKYTNTITIALKLFDVELKAKIMRSLL